MHGELQHTPSTQLFELHSVAPPHVAPFAFFPVHAPLEQKSPVMQSVSTVHVVLHAVEPHVYGAHVVVVAAGQLPAPSQLAPAVAMPPLQLAVRQFVDEGG